MTYLLDIACTDLIPCAPSGDYQGSAAGDEGGHRA